ncbi:MAG: hypothetical protein FWD58_08650 [Firmicutes bacterium]|nr:hypothetical protein [Bacillota bacterium]
MKIKVCDALCGAGKTVSCINMMNRETDKRFIFITPYLTEVERIKQCCSLRRFVSPEKKYANGFSKLNDIHGLLTRGENIVSTHSLFACYTDETKRLIREQGYTLVLDEVIDVFQPLRINGGDVDLLLRHNIAIHKDNEIIWSDEDYSGVLFSEVKQMSKSKNLIMYGESFYFWAIPPDLFGCFSEAYVLTYLFEYQLLRYFFDANSLKYELIGTRREGNSYDFCALNEMDRRVDLREKIHILQSRKRNGVGRDPFSLSSGWFERNLLPGKSAVTELKNSIYNVFRYDFEGGSCERMWTAFNKTKKALRGKGYSSGFVAFNSRATNEFANKKYLAYCVNVFMQPWAKNYLLQHGITKISQDMYALSVLVQWLFRSAIRKGEDIWVYIPSKRMRELLDRWIENLAAGDDLKEISYSALNKPEKPRKLREAFEKMRSGKDRSVT